MFLKVMVSTLLGKPEVKDCYSLYDCFSTRLTCESRAVTQTSCTIGVKITHLKHDEVLFDLSVVREATHGCDSLLSQVVLGS